MAEFTESYSASTKWNSEAPALLDRINWFYILRVSLLPITGCLIVLSFLEALRPAITVETGQNTDVKLQKSQKLFSD